MRVRMLQTLPLVRSRREWGEARVVSRAPEAIRGQANIYYLFFFVFTFP